MIVFVAWPTANVFRSNINAERWHAAGYRVSVASDLPETALRGVKSDIPILRIRKYEGYFKCMNAMTQMLVNDYSADIVVCAGDGIEPHPGIRGHEIATIFAAKFKTGMGVMQPIGDDWAPGRMQRGTQSWAEHRMHKTRPASERCESPWLGRRFITDFDPYGPFCPEYDQYFGDHELHDRAQAAGLLWKQPNLHQVSNHWSREGGPDIGQHQIKNFERAYEKDYATYRARSSKSFPQWEPPKTAAQPERGRIIVP